MGEHDWEASIPKTGGTLPEGGALCRTDPGGPTPAAIAFIGVFPAATKTRIVTVGDTRMTLPVAVESESFEAASKSGAELDTHYLGPLRLPRSEVFITDLLPYYLASTTKSSGSGRSMADNIALFENAYVTETGIIPRPPGEELLQLVRDLPGNMERLHAYFDACRPRVVFTLGAEVAAMLRGLTFKAASKSVNKLLYGRPKKLDVFGIETRVVHLVHPHLFIKKNEKWMARHMEWVNKSGRDLVESTLAGRGSSS